MQRVAQAKQQPVSRVMARRWPRVLARMPWDVVQDEMGPEAPEILGELGRLLHRAGQDEILTQLTGITEEVARLRQVSGQDAMGS